MQLKVRTAEGQGGILNVLVVPHGEAMAVPLEVPIKSLNLHERVSSIGSQELPMSQIVLQGKFDISDALLWLQSCVNDVP